MLQDFYKNKKILITGHTGFKGSWLTKILVDMGAIVCGYAQHPHTKPALFDLFQLEHQIKHVIGDIRDYEKLLSTVHDFQPEIIIHLAAQSLVLTSYEVPKETYDINLMGTVNILECVRATNTVQSFLNVTTDKVYENHDLNQAFVESDVLNGFDPYANSKSCSELITQTYQRSFFNEKNISISTARSGNVIGGGDFSNDRIIPDLVKSIINQTELSIRYPYATRPYQHVLEPLFAYLVIIMKQYNDHAYQGAYNIGPGHEDSLTTMRLIELFTTPFSKKPILSYHHQSHLHEATYLKLDSSKIKRLLNMSPQLSIYETVAWTCEWYQAWMEEKDIYHYLKSKLIHM